MESMNEMQKTNCECIDGRLGGYDLIQSDANTNLSM